jgi:hypothetical protein
MDARFRRKENLEYVAERVQKLRNCLQADVIRINKVLEIRIGKSACLGKMEGQLSIFHENLISVDIQ